MQFDSKIETKSVQHINVDQSYYWIAVNGPSATLNRLVPVPFSKVGITPIPELLLGFPTIDEAIRVQQFLIEAPMDEVRQLLDSLRQRNDVAKAVPSNPEPVTAGPTTWSFG